MKTDPGRHQRQPSSLLPACLITLSAVLLVAAGCSSPRAVRRIDPEIERNATSARSAYNANAPGDAAVFYQKALTRARLADQPGEIAPLAYNLAACFARQGKYQEALALLDEAQFECDRSGIDFPELNLLRTGIYRSLGRAGEADAAATAGLNALKGKKDALLRLQYRLALAELACDRKDSARALEELEKIDRRALEQGEPVIRARVAGARGRALVIQQKPAEAAAAFDVSAAFFREARQYEDMASALCSAGAAYEEAGEKASAPDRYYRAARSLFLSGNSALARDVFNKADTLAKETGNTRMLNALQQLEHEQSAAAGANPPPAEADAK